MSIFELRDRVLALPALEKRMDLLRAEIRKAENDVSGMLRQYERESRDVEHIQKDSLSSFLLRLSGRYEPGRAAISTKARSAPPATVPAETLRPRCACA
jgi:hypothetical protein